MRRPLRRSGRYGRGAGRGLRQAASLTSLGVRFAVLSRRRSYASRVATTITGVSRSGRRL